MDAANKSQISHLSIILSLPYTENYFSEEDTHWVRSTPRSSASAKAGKRGEATRSSTLPDTASAVGRRLLSAASRAGGSREAGAELPAGGGSAGRCCHLLLEAGTRGRPGPREARPGGAGRQPHGATRPAPAAKAAAEACLTGEACGRGTSV